MIKLLIIAMKFYLKLATVCLSSVLIVGTTTANASIAGKSHIIHRESSLKFARNPSTTLQRMTEEGEKLSRVSEDYRLANTAFAEKRYSQALPYLTRAIAKYPNSVPLYLTRAMTYTQIQLQHGTRDQISSVDQAAMADFETVLKMEPNNPKAYYERGAAQCTFLRFSAGHQDLLAAARLFKLEGDTASYNDAMKFHADAFIIEANFRTPPLIFAPNPVSGGGYHDPSRAVRPW